jgi:hypothetical protein
LFFGLPAFKSALSFEVLAARGTILLGKDALRELLGAVWPSAINVLL